MFLSQILFFIIWNIRKTREFSSLFYSKLPKILYLAFKKSAPSIGLREREIEREREREREQANLLLCVSHTKVF